MSNTAPSRFWEEKAFSELSPAEWESLCDGCAQCCLVKLQDDETEEIHLTNVACHLLDIEECRCGDYVNRLDRVESCLSLAPEKTAQFAILPETCAYRCLYEGRALPAWHPLLTQQATSVHQAGISVRGYAVSEEFIHPEQLEDHILRSR